MKSNSNCKSNKEKQEIIDRNKNRIKEFTTDEKPRVSIIVLNRNGELYLDVLFKSIKENTLYSNYEIIVVDNLSRDKSRDIIGKWIKELPIKLICNNYNKSFALGNNEAAREANGDFLLFLNNDIEVTYGWLQELLRIFYEFENVGATGGKLIYPCSEKKEDKSLKVQHSGVNIKKIGRKFFDPYNMGNGLEPYSKEVDEISDTLGVTGAMLLIKKDIFFSVDGFNEKYVYGLEDVDLCLKVIEKGYRVIYTPTSMAFHYESWTIEKERVYISNKKVINNMKVFNEAWGIWINNRIKVKFMKE